MRIYTDDDMETLRARKFLTEWKTEGLVTDEQYGQLEAETFTELRTTNLFLRVVLFFFTILCVCAGGGLFALVFFHGASDQTYGLLLLVLGVVSYAAAEYAVSEFSLYRHGIEEALAVCSVAFLCVGLFASLGPSFKQSHYAETVIAGVGAALSLWIWHRFGLWYAFLGAMIFAGFVPGDWTASHVAVRVLIVAIYMLGLLAISAVRSRHRDDYLDKAYSLAEAFLWLGIYLTLNLKILALNLPVLWFREDPRAAAESAGPFYWITWVLIWCLPLVVLARGIRLRDRFVIAAGAVAAILTLISNKPYFGWPRHTWDPMILGIVLTGAAFYLRRWLMEAPGGIRYGFTAASLSKKDRGLLNVGSSALGLLSPHPPASSVVDGPSHGGESGGAGASREF